MKNVKKTAVLIFFLLFCSCLFAASVNYEYAKRLSADIGEGVKRGQIYVTENRDRLVVSKTIENVAVFDKINTGKNIQGSELKLRKAPLVFVNARAGLNSAVAGIDILTPLYPLACSFATVFDYESKAFSFAGGISVSCPLSLLIESDFLLVRSGQIKGYSLFGQVFSCGVYYQNIYKNFHWDIGYDFLLKTPFIGIGAVL